MKLLDTGQINAFSWRLEWVSSDKNIASCSQDGKRSRKEASLNAYEFVYAEVVKMDETNQFKVQTLQVNALIQNWGE